MTTYYVTCEEKTVWTGTIEADDFAEALDRANHRNIRRSVHMNQEVLPIRCVEIGIEMEDGSVYPCKIEKE